jgi:hypothetical protein
VHWARDRRSDDVQALGDRWSSRGQVRQYVHMRLLTAGPDDVSSRALHLDLSTSVEKVRGYSSTGSSLSRQWDTAC